MPDESEWKKALGESNALGWIAFLVLVIAIGVGTIIFGGTPNMPKGNPIAANRSSQSK